MCFNCPNMTNVPDAAAKPFNTGRDINVLLMDPTRNIESSIKISPVKKVAAITNSILVKLGCIFPKSSATDPNSRDGMLIGPKAIDFEEPMRLYASAGKMTE